MLRKPKKGSPMPLDPSASTPHIESPPTRENSPDNGLACWKHDLRICGPACMAYQDDNQVPEGKDYRDAESAPFQWSRCRVLTDNHKQAKYLTVLGQSVNNHIVRLSQLPAPQVK